MQTTLRLARVGMSMEQATLRRWHKCPGERFSAGEALYEIETEKVSQEVAAPAAGILLECCAGEGDELCVGAAVCVVELTDPPAGGDA